MPEYLAPGVYVEETSSRESEPPTASLSLNYTTIETTYESSVRDAYFVKADAETTTQAAQGQGDTFAFTGLSSERSLDPVWPKDDTGMDPFGFDQSPEQASGDLIAVPDTGASDADFQSDFM